MGDLRIRPWHPDDADAVAALSRRYFAPDPPLTPAGARALLSLDAVGGGAQVWIAERAAAVIGLVAYVIAPPILYLWPLAADDGAAIAALFDHAIATTRCPELTTVRVSARPVEPHKAPVLAARGLAPTMAFVELVRPPTPPLPDATTALACHRGAAIDRARAHALHDRAFAEIDNTSPLSADDFASMLDGPSAWPAATAAWVDADGAPRGVVIGARHHDHGVVEAIAVDPAWRGRGLGRVMVAHVLATAAAEGLPEVRAMVASTNGASLALHRRAGFVDRYRKEVWSGPL